MSPSTTSDAIGISDPRSDQALSTAAPTRPGIKGKKPVRVSTSTAPVTLSGLAQDLEREDRKLAEQRAAVAATEARIAEKQKALRTLMDAVGRRK
jgi:hypothetical protein